jgi:hypothetical protein
MCTVVLLRRPGHRWPLIIAANRDEMADRPWAPPARHWPDREEVVGGLDRLGGGSWLGVNDHGVVAGVLNREGSLGPENGKRSRGELVLEALDHADAAAAAEALSELDARSYRTFNLVVADSGNAYWLRNQGGAGAEIEVFPIPPGLSMITALNRNDPKSARIRAYLPRFERAAAPDPDARPQSSAWGEWERLLSSRLSETESNESGEGGPLGAMSIATEGGFGTVSSSIIALPAPASPPRRPVWRFAAGAPGEAPFEPVSL